ncbi:MAG: glycoside hydrolase family 15 protein [Gammaproteobacteria bacterium]
MTHPTQNSGRAPGHPGISPTWSSSAKEMVGCALGPSRIWFTVGGGIVNEVYYPRVDIPQIRDLGFIVADNHGFWVEVKRLDARELSQPDPGVPAVDVVHRHSRFTLQLRIVPDPVRDVLLIQVRLQGDDSLRPYLLLAPHLGGTGHDNLAATAYYRGRQVLWAEQGPFGLAIAAIGEHQRDAIEQASAGYVGASDGWQDFRHNGAMCWHYRSAGPGNVALMAALPQRTVVALGLASSKESAATLAISALLQPFDQAWQRQIDDWQAWHRRCTERRTPMDGLSEALRRQVRVSAMVLRSHQDKIYPGAMVASLSVPWGNRRDERGGYHLVWPRDLVECAVALLALGATDEAQNILRYLIATQHADGRWNQNQWLGGKAFWSGIQLDEAAFPVLLAETLNEQDALDGIEIGDMVRRALGFILRTGPATDQDRWEEDAGVSTFTLAVCIAALVAGAPTLDPPARDLALAVADYWNSRIEDWTLARDTALSRRFHVPGYYVRVAPNATITDEQAIHDALPIKNRAEDAAVPADQQVGVDFLQLVRFDLRRFDDPGILATLAVTDALLKADTPNGPAWHRYDGDGYGEHADGRAFDGTGIGRAWPLLSGERGHYELVAGKDPTPYLQAMAAMSGGAGMIPEQVWDGDDLPASGLVAGRPTGSAMPLAWAHAEFIKLVASRPLGTPFDRPRAVSLRYGGRAPRPDHCVWLQQAPIDRLRRGNRLLVVVHQAALVHWGVDGWHRIRENPTHDSGLGLHVAELDTRDLYPGQQVNFTLRYRRPDRWAGRDYVLTVGN